jgi:histidinol-phosphate aminotransferase
MSIIIVTYGADTAFMTSNRRTWLKNTGLAIAGLGLAPLESFAFTDTRVADVAAQPFIRLRSNENPYGPSPMAREAMSKYINESNRYGWQLTSALIAAVAQAHGLAAENILLGAGSTEILDITAQLAARQTGNFIIADPSYDYWTDTATGLGLQKIKVPLRADKHTDLDAMLKAINQHTRLVYICNPNNPTGTISNRESLVAFLKKAGTQALVLVDEAYLDFSDQQSLSSLVSGHKNLVIAKTFSKIYGLAGARVGYAIAHPDTINDLSKMRSTPHGSISVVSAAAAIASLQDGGFVTSTRLQNEQAKTYTAQQLEGLGIRCIASATNFIYFSLSGYKPDFFARLAQANILGTRIYEEDGKWSRITIGTMDEMKQFVEAIR